MKVALTDVVTQERTRHSPLPDRTAEMRWLREHRGEHRGQWVALWGDKLVGAGATLGEARRMADLAGVERPLFDYVDEEEHLPFVAGW